MPSLQIHLILKGCYFKTVMVYARWYDTVLRYLWDALAFEYKVLEIVLPILSFTTVSKNDTVCRL